MRRIVKQNRRKMTAEEATSSAFSRHCEKRSDEAIHMFWLPNGLLRFARNDD
jgi:hypothetical protein